MPHLLVSPRNTHLWCFPLFGCSATLSRGVLLVTFCLFHMFWRCCSLGSHGHRRFWTPSQPQCVWHHMVFILTHDSLMMLHLQWLLLFQHYRQSASVLQSTLRIWALFIFPFLKSARVVSRSEVRISVVANLCFSSKVKLKVMSNISVSLGNLRRENRNLWDQMTERIYCHKKKAQNDATISVIHCINNIYLIEQMQDETVWVEMSNIVVVYNTPNCLWQVTSVMYWAVNDGQIMLVLICKKKISKSSQLKANCTWPIIQQWAGQEVCICSESTPLCAEQVQLCERRRWLMCCTSDLGDSMGVWRRKTSSLHFHTCIYYSPKTCQWRQWRNEWASSSPQKVIRRSPEVNVSFTILTRDPWPETLWGHRFISNSLCCSAARRV